jgi:hypothetical protein
VLEVPGEYVSIQAAIDAAVDGDEVLVDAGTYYEHISFLGKTIVVRSRDGADVTVMHGQGADATIVQVPSGSAAGTAIEGFTIRNGYRSANNVAAGIDVAFNTSLRIGHCRIEDCSAQHGGGLAVHGGDASDFHMHDSILANCNAVHAGGLCDLGGSKYGQTTVERTVFSGGHSWNDSAYIHGNAAALENPAMILFCTFDGGSGTALGALRVGFGAAVIDGCVFRNGSGGGWGGKAGDALAVGMFASPARADVRNCVFVDNGAPVAATRAGDPNVSAEMWDSVFCNNNTPNLQGPWQLSNVLELNGCPEELDCDQDGQVDWIQCVTQPELDVDGNWIPDACECPADTNDDAEVNIDDLLLIIGAFGTTYAPADIDLDGIVSVDDLLLCINAWGPC